MGEISHAVIGVAKRYLSAEEASWFVGVSLSVFRAEVKSGVWPQGRRRGEKGGRLTWDRKLLDLAIDRQSGLDIPVTVAESMVRTEADAWESRLNVAEKVWPERRSKAS